MTHATRPPIDPRTLVAHLQLRVLELVVWLAEMVGHGALGARLRAWARADLARLERGAEAVAVLLALRLLPSPPPARHSSGRRPLDAPRGFRCACAHDTLRGVARPSSRASATSCGAAGALKPFSPGSTRTPRASRGASRASRRRAG
jgi:hypothetical protein